MIKTSRYKELVLDSFLVPETDMIFGDGVGAFFVRGPYSTRDGLKTGPPRRHRIQSVEGPVLDPRAKETCLNRGQKVDPLKSKVVPPGESSFGPFIVANLLKHLFQVEVDLTSSEWKLELWRPIFAHLLFLTF